MFDNKAFSGSSSPPFATSNWREREREREREMPMQSQGMATYHGG